LTRHHVQVLAHGFAHAPAVVLAEPLSLWGGFDPVSGLITDQNHPDCGMCLSSQIVVMSSGRGSSSASSVLAEAIRLGTAPAGFVLSRPDEILVLGSLVGAELYEHNVPIVLALQPALAAIATGDSLIVSDGTITVGDS